MQDGGITGGKVWLGLRYTSGAWAWDSGATYDSALQGAWPDGNSNKQAGNDCVALDVAARAWVQMPCNRPLAHFCEAPGVWRGMARRGGSLLQHACRPVAPYSPSYLMSRG